MQTSVTSWASKKGRRKPPEVRDFLEMRLYPFCLIFGSTSWVSRFGDALLVVPSCMQVTQR
eukprot:5897528-Amphidinium_carterae.1